MSNMTHYLQFTNSDELFKVPSTAAEVGAAPTGYGYGGTAVPLSTNQIFTEDALTSSLNAMYGSMVDKETKLVYFYGFPSLGSNGNVSDYSFFGFLFRGSVNYGSFIAYSAYNGGCTITKTRRAGNWGVLEWTNPPLLLNQEYRTTERWNGSAVYRKIVSATVEFKSPNKEDNPTSTTYKTATVAHGITDFSHIISCDATSDTQKYLLPFVKTDGTTSLDIHAVDSSNIQLRVYNDSFPSRVWYFDLKYIKT